MEHDNPAAAGGHGREAPEGPRDPQQPFVGPNQPLELRLPLDERPIPYALTARGRRSVAPDEPPLRVVDGHAGGGVDDIESELDDPRSVQARALRRAGMPVPAIAQRLKVDAFTVRAWLGGRRAPVPVPIDDDAPGDDDGLVSAAIDTWEALVDADVTFAAGMATLGSLADVDGGAVVLVSDRPAALAQGLAFLRNRFEVAPSHIRVVLRLGPLVAADRAVHDWALALNLPTDRLRHVRSGRLPAADGIEVLVRVTGAGIAATVGAWLREHQRTWRLDPHRLAGTPAG